MRLHINPAFPYSYIKVLKITDVKGFFDNDNLYYDPIGRNLICKKAFTEIIFLLF